MGLRRAAPAGFRERFFSVGITVSAGISEPPFLERENACAPLARARIAHGRAARRFRCWPYLELPQLPQKRFALASEIARFTASKARAFAGRRNLRTRRQTRTARRRTSARMARAGINRRWIRRSHPALRTPCVPAVGQHPTRRTAPASLGRGNRVTRGRSKRRSRSVLTPSAAGSRGESIHGPGDHRSPAITRRQAEPDQPVHAAHRRLSGRSRRTSARVRRICSWSYPWPASRDLAFMCAHGGGE